MLFHSTILISYCREYVTDSKNNQPLKKSYIYVILKWTKSIVMKIAEQIRYQRSRKQQHWQTIKQFSWVKMLFRQDSIYNDKLNSYSERNHADLHVHVYTSNCFKFVVSFQKQLPNLVLKTDLHIAAKAKNLSNHHKQNKVKTFLFLWLYSGQILFTMRKKLSFTILHNSKFL